jgi:hypothetical protein
MLSIPPTWHPCRSVTTDLTWNLIKSYLLTYSMEQIPSWEAKGFSAGHEIPRILWNPKVQYRIHKCPRPVLTNSTREIYRWLEKKLVFLRFNILYLFLNIMPYLCRFVLELVAKPSHAEAIVICRVFGN